MKIGIYDAKVAFKREILNHFINNDPWWVWHGIQHLTNYKTSNLETGDRDALLAEEVNCIFAGSKMKGSKDSCRAQMVLQEECWKNVQTSSYLVALSKVSIKYF